ncbi:putative transcription factor B3-Domain family [Rosa chinensis]|uniref:Putative transcription factor B3-Domain family n=1 Tax=Rosa chinensis TaxID=74649 RepID=A0A2P6SPQ2_ROSCH|nr:putative transcription factor B3-Domain family [Rosa chinensis]
MTVPPSEISLRLSDSKANFFKVILPPTIENQKLDIPLKSALEFGDELSNVATLIVPAGRVWQVDLERAHKTIWFVGGWQKFAEYYSLTDGQFLVFSYQGNSTFHVRIFYFSCCEIEYPCVGHSIKHEEDVEDDVCGTLPSPSKGKGKCVDQHVKRKRKSVAIAKRFEDDVYKTLPSSSKGKGKDQHVKRNRKSVAIAKRFKRAKLKVQRMPSSQEFPTRKKKYKEIFVKNIAAYTYPNCKMTIAKEQQKVIHATKMFNLENPFFAVILQQCNLDSYYMYVPTAFGRRYMRGCPEYIKFEDSNSNEKQWVIRCFFPSDTKVMRRIGKGCGEFFRDNNFKNGDVCLFELIKRKDVVLKFSVLRNAEYAVRVGGKNKNPKIHDCGTLYFSKKIKELVLSRETKKAMKAAGALKIENPAFMVILRAHNMLNSFVHVPAEFVKDHLLGCANFINLKASSDKRGVPCTVCTYEPLHHRMEIRGGFGEFAKDNNLEEGDVCVFELIKSEADALKVSIFHASDYAK